MLAVRLPDFEGPLDLLLARVERREIDATTLALAGLIADYCTVLRAAGAIDIDLLASFIAIAARLMQLKAAALVPRPPAPAPIEEDEAAAAARLAAMLEEYGRFKAAAGLFREREQEGLRSYPRLAPAPLLPAGPPSVGNLTLERLVAAVQSALARRPPDRPEAVPRYTVTVRERLAALQAVLAAEGRVNFSAFIAACTSRTEIIVGFMAVLELIKGGRAGAEQPEPFGDILIIAHPPDP